MQYILTSLMLIFSMMPPRAGIVAIRTDLVKKKIIQKFKKCTKMSLSFESTCSFPWIEMIYINSTTTEITKSPLCYRYTTSCLNDSAHHSKSAHAFAFNKSIPFTMTILFLNQEPSSRLLMQRENCLLKKFCRLTYESGM